MAELKGNKYGTHRVIEPKGVLTQAAWKIDNDMTKVYSNEIVCDVTSLNIDSASFTQISEACGGDEKKIGEMIMSIVAERGKQQNPVTGSGGMFKGVVAHIGEDLKNKPGFDFTAFFARGGVLGTLFDKDSLPMLTIAGFGDHQVGLYLASGVLAALYRAKQTGQGDRVVVSLFHSAIWDVSLMLQSNQYGDPATQFPLSRRTLPNPLVVAHKTKDNKWLQIAMPQYNRHYPIFMRAIGHPEMAEDPRYYPQTNLQANIEEFYDFLVAEMATRTLDEWCALMDANDLPYAIAQTWDQLLVDKQAWASDCFYEMEYPNGAKRTMVRPPVMFEETPLPPYNRGPYLGEQTEEILKKLGYTDEQVAAMIAAGDAAAMDPALKD